MILETLNPSEATSLLKNHVGGKVRLTQDYMSFKANSEWHIKNVNNLGGTCVMAVTPVAGGKGFFGPYKLFALDAEVAEEAAVEPAVEAAPVPSGPPFETPRGEFNLDGFDVEAPLSVLFRDSAPDSDTAKELFMTYAAEYSEFDTEFFEDLMRKANVRPMAWWSDANVTSMLMLLNETQDSAFDDIESPEEAPGVDEPQQDEDENGPTVAARMRRILAEQAQPAPAPESKPAIFIHPDVKQPLSGPEPAAPKRRGRPPGSKNKVDPGVKVVDLGHFPGPEPTPQPAVRAIPESVLNAALDNLPRKAPEPVQSTRHFSDYLEPKAPEPTPPVAREVRVIKETPVTQISIAPSPLAVELACRILPEIGSDEDPAALLDQVVATVRRALLLDD